MSQTVLLREKKYFWAPLWGLAFFIMVVLGTMFWFLQYNVTYVYDNNFNKGLLAEFAESKKKTDISVVMLGNSRMRNAIHAGYSVDETHTLPDGRSITFLQFANNASMMMSYESLLPEILHARPDVLIIQPSLISNLKYPNYQLIDYFTTALEFYTERLKRVTPYQKWYDSRHTPIECKARKFNRKELNSYLAYISNVHHTLGADNPSFTLAQGFIRNARLLGIEVIVLRIDPYVDFFKEMDVPLHVSAFHGLGYEPSYADLLPDSYNDVTWLRYTETDHDNYCDIVHVNDKGAEKFTNWLLNEIEDVKPR